MGIDKFMSMLSEESLYFPNIYSFNDRYEGFLSKKSIEEVYKTNLLDEKNTPIAQDEKFYEMKNFVNTGLDANDKATDLKVRHSFLRLLENFSSHFMFCSCWFLKESESHSMWAEYGDKSPTSIAIVTTIERLIKSLKSVEYHIHIGKVEYKNYEEEHITSYEDFPSKDLTKPDTVLELFYAPIMHKRDIYDDEHEVRAVISFESICENHTDRVYTSKIPFYSDRLFETGNMYFNHDKTNLMKDIPTKGIAIKININQLVRKVVISPNANSYFEKSLKELLEKHNMDPEKVCPSKI